MKKTILLAILGLTATVTATFGAGSILLDNYNTTGPYVTYSGVPANGVSGPLGSGKIVGNPSGTSPWTVGLYFALGNVTGSIASDPTGEANPTTLGGGLTLGTGTGSIAGVNDLRTPDGPGAFLAGATFQVPGTADTGGDTITVMLTVYNGSSYNTANFRAHSAAFVMTTSANTASSPNRVGQFMPAFGIVAPEPSMAALWCIGGGALMLVRRKKNLKSGQETPRS